MRKHFERLTKVPEAKDPNIAAPLTPTQARNEIFVQQAEELDRLRQVASQGQLVDLKRDTAAEIARIIANNINHDKLVELHAAIGSEVKKAEPPKAKSKPKAKPVAEPKAKPVTKGAKAPKAVEPEPEPHHGEPSI